MAEAHPSSVAQPNGPDIAAILAAATGLLVLAVVQVATVLSDGFKDFVFDVGKAWIPGAEGIGPYSGKETFALAGWLGSWGALRWAWGQRELDVRPWFGLALGTLLVATLLLWPPVWHLIE